MQFGGVFSFFLSCDKAVCRGTQYSPGTLLSSGESRVLPGDCMNSQYVLMQADKPQLPSNVLMSSSYYERGEEIVQFFQSGR